jgi:PIN domain nuclease of toxin-antitoxin system
MTRRSSQMKAILDTHALLWFAGGDQRLPLKIRKLIEESGTELYISVASIWEIVIKTQKGTLTLDLPPRRWVLRALRGIGARPLPVRLRHALQVASLPLLHHDPFDRLLIAQANAESLPLITHDATIEKYEVDVIW